MKLTELQKKITPGPLKIPIPFSPDLIGVEREDGSRKLVAQTHGSNMQYDAAYLAHCANQMPKVINMLQRMVDETSGGGTPCLLTLEHARAAIAAAEEVEEI